MRVDGRKWENAVNAFPRTCTVSPTLKKQPLPALHVPEVHLTRSPPSTTKVYDSYWRFAVERQAIYHRRLAGGRGPWTSDPILAEYKFTNAYRAADRVSQHLIREVIYGEEFTGQDTVFRILLFKLFNKIETWKLLESEIGRLCLDTFDPARFDEILTRAFLSGARVYSAAYIMPQAPRSEDAKFKHRTHLDLLETVVRNGMSERLLESRSMRQAYDLLLSLPSIGPFLAYQYAIDLAYSSHFSFCENEFVQPGPGALNGLSKCFSSLGDYSPADAIRWVTERQENEFKARDLQFQSLFGRPLHLIDCQNLFCEVDKYARVAHPEFSEQTGRSRIKQRFAPTGPLPVPHFPPKWNLKIPSTLAAASNLMCDSLEGAQSELVF